MNFFILLVLLQHGADPNIRNTDGKTALDVAEASAKLVLTGIYNNIALHLSQAPNNNKPLALILLIILPVHFPLRYH